jgi:hypothetical protein
LDTALIFLRRWTHLATRYADALDALRSGSGRAHAQPLLAAAGCDSSRTEADLRQVQWALWVATGERDLVKRNAERALIRAETCLVLTRDVRARPEAVSEPMRVTFALASGRRSAVRARTRRVDFVPTSVNAVRIRRLPTRADAAFAGIAFVVALTGWSLTSYTGNAFGSPTDYLGAFAWGAGTSTGMVVLSAMIEKLRAAPLRGEA